MPLVINSLGHGQTRTHIPMIRTGSILRNQVRAGLRAVRAWFNKVHINGTLCDSANAVLEMYTCTYSGLIATKDTSEPAHFGVILLLHRGYPPSEVKLCRHDTVGTIEIALYTYAVRKNELCPTVDTVILWMLSFNLWLCFIYRTEP